MNHFPLFTSFDFLKKERRQEDKIPFRVEFESEE
jgi:hypothetical protein